MSQPPETGEFLRQLGSEENDIVIAILAATHLETLIDLVLDEVLVPGPDAKAIRKQQASRKIGLLFALGLLTEGSRNDLDVILDIRNYFAHRVFGGTAAFSDAEVASLVAKLSPSNRQEDWKYVPAYLRLLRAAGTPVEAAEEDLRLGYGNGTPLLTLQDRLKDEECFGVAFGDDVLLGGHDLSAMRDIALDPVTKDGKDRKCPRATPSETLNAAGRERSPF